jgi:hypothetical protein
MRLMVAVAAPVTIFVAPGPIELTQANVEAVVHFGEAVM